MTKLRRYQLTKDAIALIERHPWIFREQLSSAATTLPDGAWLRLFDGQNQVVGHGVYEAEGAIGIRILRRGTAPPDAAWVRAQVAAAIVRRAPLAARTTAMRVVHGESDGLAAVTIDRYGDVLVAQSYGGGVDALARYAALRAAHELSVPNVIVHPATRRRGTSAGNQIVRGKPGTTAEFTEDGLAFAVDLDGQKSGAYLDLRALRHLVASLPLAGARVLNLFSYSGMLARCAERAGAATIVSVDQSDRALAFARAHHVDDPAKHEFVEADVFDWMPVQPIGAGYDLAIVDPPAMTSQMKQVPIVIAAYKKLYAAVAPHVKPGGLLIAACCTSRIERKVFTKVVGGALGKDFSHERDLAPEVDHPVGFTQADYLKIGLWRRAAT